jgi:hypothetical protein
MKFIDFSEFCDAIVAEAPIVSLDVCLNQISAVGEVLDRDEIFKGDLLNFYLRGVIHVKI